MTIAIAHRERSSGVDHSTLDTRLRGLLADLRERASIHHPRFEEMSAVIARLTLGGKKLRPAVFSAALRGLTGDDAAATGRDAVDIACALELLHVALVIHDDVIDSDSVRRGEPNVSGQARDAAIALGASAASAEGFGRAAGIIAGDLLLSSALSLVATTEFDAPTRRALITLFEQTIFASAAGEHADVWFSLGLEEADATRLLRTIELKTACYSFQAPLEAAAILAGCDADTVRRLRGIGCGLGIVYQLRDDVLGVFGSTDATGKTVSGDLREGTQTLLVALARDTPQWQAVAHRFGAADLDEADAEALRAALDDSGARERVERAIEAECAVVRRRISRGRFPAEMTGFLLDLLERCAERDR